jgi:hypothetical protein
MMSPRILKMLDYHSWWDGFFCPLKNVIEFTLLKRIFRIVARTDFDNVKMTRPSGE